MHVYVRVAATNRSNDFGKFFGPDLLANIATADRHDACGRNRPGEGTGSIGAVRRPGRSSILTRLAEPENDAAVHTGLSDMDVRLCWRRIWASNAGARITV
jgi:hypothetical protein